MIIITAYTAAGEKLAQVSHPAEALLRVDRTYQDGDYIEITSDCKHLTVQMDATILPGEVYLPEGSWTNLLTGEVLTGGTCVKATANLGQIPVYLNNDSKDASELLPIFKGTNWRLIQNHK